MQKKHENAVILLGEILIDSENKAKKDGAIKDLIDKIKNTKPTR